MLNGVTECLGVTWLNTRHTYLYTYTTRKTNEIFSGIPM